MWGNKLGWIISAVLALVVPSLAYMVMHRLSNISPPSGYLTNASLGYLDSASFPKPLDALMSRNEPGDAGDLYRQAINAFKGEDEEAIRGFNNAGGLATPNAKVARQFVDKYIIPAMHMKSMTLFRDKPEELINYKPWDERMGPQSLQAIGKAVWKIANELGNQKKTDECMKYAQALFAMGYGLYSERLIYQEYDLGVGMMRDAVYVIQKISTNPAQTQAAEEFEKTRRDWMSPNGRMWNLWAWTYGISEKIISEHAGDMYYLTEHSKEPMWRVEAILKLGRYRFNASRWADQQTALTWVKRIAADEKEDRVIRMAAKVASEMTVEQYRMMR